MDETVESGPRATLQLNSRARVNDSPLVVSVVVNYRGLADTRACVESLLAVDYSRHEIVVVENGSGDGEADALAAALPAAVHFIRSNTNLGYGGGANLGLRWAAQAGAEYVWVLNNDTTVDARSVAELVRAMESDPSCGAASPQIEAAVGPDSPRGVWYAGGVADLRRVVTQHTHDLLETDAPLVSTGFVSGCAIFLRTRALAEVGMFWERLFLYWEDVELSFRLRAAGWRLAIAPAARIRHIGHDGVISAVANYCYYRNAVLVAQRQLGPRGGAEAFLSLWSRAGRRWLACVVKGRRPWPMAETRGLFAGVIAVLRGEAREGRN
ncbi:MAG TPA: glycosyltransferase family 2 protein [Candidatus Limnocylindrales bacterium]